MTQICNEYWAATAMAVANPMAVANANTKTNTKTNAKTPVTLYGEDGSMYTGHVNECGAKHGEGSLKTAIYITGCMGDDNSHLMKWTEYTGNWSDGVLHGHGIMRKMSGNGVVAQVVHDGMWSHGVPIV